MLLLLLLLIVAHDVERDRDICGGSGNGAATGTPLLALVRIRAHFDVGNYVRRLATRLMDFTRRMDFEG